MSQWHFFNRSLIAVATVGLLVGMPLVVFWVRTLEKYDQPGAYAVALVVGLLLLIQTPPLRRRLSGTVLTSALSAGVLGGYSAGLVAYVVNEAVRPTGPERILNALERYPAEFLATVLFSPVLTGAWFVGASVGVVMVTMARKRREHPH